MNNYHIYSELGKGKGSIVYKGRAKKCLEYVSIKSVEKAYKKKVLNEVAVLYALHHTNVLKFINWYETSRHIWLIVAYCTGGDLLHMLRQDHSMPEYSCQRFAADILAGMQFVHSKGYIYCDLKPSNILVDDAGTLMLCDFGLARKVQQEEGAAADKDANQNKRGSPYYMSPELFYSDGIHSFASDIYAFGCVLYELATGRPPFYSKSLEEVVQQILEAEAVPLPPAPTADEERLHGDRTPTTPANPHGHSFSTAMQDLVSRCLEKDPARRITWSEIRSHPWWDQPARGLGVEGAATLPRGFRLPDLPLPDQPVFRRLFLGEQASHASTPFNGAQSLRASQQGMPDIMRMSFQAKKNRQLEQEMQAAARAAAQHNSAAAVNRQDSLPTRSPHMSNHHQDVPAAPGEVEEALEASPGDMTIPDCDTELDFSAAGPQGEAETVADLPPSSVAAAAQRPASSARTFREPPRPAQPSELDRMEELLLQQHNEEEGDGYEEQDADQHDADDGATAEGEEPGIEQGPEEDEEWQQAEQQYQAQKQQQQQQQQQKQNQQRAAQSQQAQQSQQHGRRDSDDYEDAVALNDRSGHYNRTGEIGEEYEDDVDETAIEEDLDADADTSTEQQHASRSSRSTQPAPATRRQPSLSKLPVLASRLPAAAAAGPADKRPSVSGKAASSSSSSASRSRSNSGKKSDGSGSSGTAAAPSKKPATKAASSSSATAAAASRSKKPTPTGSAAASPSKPPSTAGSTRSNKPSTAAGSSTASIKRTSTAHRPPSTAESASSAAAARRAAAAVTRAASIEHDDPYSQSGPDSHSIAYDDHNASDYRSSDAHHEPQHSPFHQQRMAWQEQQQQQSAFGAGRR